MYFFKPVPVVSYDVGGVTQNVTNIMLHSKLVDLISSKAAIYYEYDIQDSDRPDIIASKYYGDASLDWVVIVVNQMIDPLFEWPMSHDVLMKYIDKKYGGINAAYSTVRTYSKILSKQQTLFDGTVLPERLINVDEDTYSTLVDTDRTSQSYYDWEIEVNDKRRTIKVLKKEYVDQFVGEYKGMYS